MMRVLVVSDTHGFGEAVEGVLKQVGKIDMLVHCGDVEHDEDYIKALVDCPVHMVAGNCDFNSNLPYHDIFNIGDYTVMAVHGHTFYVHGSTMYLREFAQEHGIDIVMYGHTHRPYIEINEDVTILNPGSLAFPRQEDRRSTFLLMEVDDLGEAHYAHGYYNREA